MSNAMSTRSVGLSATISEGKRELRVRRSTIYELIRDGKLKLIKIDRALRARWEDRHRLGEGGG
jgi:hypothetical protein